MPKEQIDLAGSLAIIDGIQTVIDFFFAVIMEEPTPCCLFCDDGRQITLLISLFMRQSTYLDMKLYKFHRLEREREGKD